VSITIRQATDADVPRVQALYARWVEDDITHGLVQPGTDHFRSRLGPFFIVAECDGVVVGFAIGTERTSDGLAVIPKGERYVEIDDVYVIPEHQRSGIGSGLIQEIESQAASADVGRFLVYSASRDVDGIMRFYRSHGYEPWYVQMVK
jgi:GNAT superfamily N-acetyltransferase